MKWVLITFIVLSFSCSIVTAASWHEVARWSGSDRKDTETFYIKSKQWRISWEYSGRKGGDTGVFIFSALREDGTWAKQVASRSGRGSGDSIMRSGPGEYYLEIVSNAGSWTIIVEDKR